MILKMNKFRNTTVTTIEEASRIYCERREASGLGGSKFRDGAILDDGAEIARISYNGKVWEAKEWEAGDVPLFNPYAVEMA